MIEPNLIEHIRLKIALNHFKRSVLNDLHIPNKSQVNALFSSFENINTGTVLTHRTWQSWFSLRLVRPKKLKLKELKKISDKLGCEFDGVFLNDDFESLTFGISIHEIKNNQSSKISTNYQVRDCSSLKLFLDAIQFTFYKNLLEPKETLVIETLAEKALYEIYLRWNPVSGYLYSKLPSDLKMTWKKASLGEKNLIKKSFEKFKPNLFNFLYNSHPTPKQFKSLIVEEVEPNLIYKFLIELTSDHSFLDNNDRLKIWIFELFAAVLLLRLIYSINRDKNKIVVTNEMVTCEVLFDFLKNLSVREGLSTSIEMEFLDHFKDFQDEQLDILKNGIKLFNNELNELGVKFEDIVHFVP